MIYTKKIHFLAAFFSILVFFSVTEIPAFIHAIQPRDCRCVTSNNIITSNNYIAGNCTTANTSKIKIIYNNCPGHIITNSLSKRIGFIFRDMTVAASNLFFTTTIFCVVLLFLGSKTQVNQKIRLNN